MKPNKYDALEFCRRAIRSCITKKQMNTVHKLCMNFNLMFHDILCSNLLENEWYNKFKNIERL